MIKVYLNPPFFYKHIRRPVSVENTEVLRRTALSLVYDKPKERERLKSASQEDLVSFLKRMGFTKEEVNILGE